MQGELWVYSPELDRSFVINNADATIAAVELTEKEREEIRERHEAEEWEQVRREYYDECYRDEPDYYFPEEEG